MLGNSVTKENVRKFIIGGAKKEKGIINYLTVQSYGNEIHS